jgi:hypothetical protein
LSANGNANPARRQKGLRIVVRLGRLLSLLRGRAKHRQRRRTIFRPPKGETAIPAARRDAVELDETAAAVGVCEYRAELAPFHRPISAKPLAVKSPSDEGLRFFVVSPMQSVWHGR